MMRLISLSADDEEERKGGECAGNKQEFPVFPDERRGALMPRLDD